MYQVYIWNVIYLIDLYKDLCIEFLSKIIHGICCFVCTSSIFCMGRVRDNMGLVAIGLVFDLLLLITHIT